MIGTSLTFVDSLRGPFSDAALVALFVDNSVPLPSDIEEAARDMAIYSDAVDRIIAAHPVLPRIYIKDQPVYGPIVTLMAQAGWTLSGAGYFSVAFFKGGLAMKLGLRPHDDAALPYLHWCKVNADLPGVPLLHAMATYGNTYAVLMDRYERIVGETDERSVLYDPRIAGEFEAIRAAVNTGFSGHCAVSHTGVAIRHEFSDVGHFDIKPDNVMIDRDGNLIITDPIGMTGSSVESYDSYTYSSSAAA